MTGSGLQQTILTVLAHPDDESFGMGGTLALYAERGVDVHLVCATRGEAGEVGPDYLQNYDTIGQLREAELMCASNHLGLKEVHFLPYRDSGMPDSEDNQHPEALVNAPREEVISQIVTFIRTLKPQVVITFDPIGGYYHPDHIYMHQTTKAAFYKAGDPDYQPDQPPYQPDFLYYHTISKRFLQFNVRLLRLLGKDPTRWGKNEDIDLTELAAKEFPVHARVDYRPVEHRKEAASACHASQSGSSLSAEVIRWVFRLFGAGRKDLFMQAFPAPREGVIKEDLFAKEDPDLI
jgi:LmbE family N-acetylglucosaminyl deacetylase